MKKVIVLVLMALIPVFFALLGYSGFAEQQPANIGLVRALTLSPWVAAMLGGIVALIMRQRRAMWWSMIVCFVYSYLTLGLIWGGFWTEGVFGKSMFSAASTFAAISFIGAAFTFGMVTVIQKALANINEQ